MGQFFHVTVREAAEGMKINVIASPSFWKEIADNGGNWSATADDVRLSLDLPGQREIEVVQLNTIGGTEDFGPTPDDPAE